MGEKKGGVKGIDRHLCAEEETAFPGPRVARKFPPQGVGEKEGWNSIALTRFTMPR